MARKIYDVVEVDFDYADLAAFKTEEEAEDFRRKLMSQLNSFIIKYSDGLWTVSIPYVTEVHLGRSK